MLQRRRWSWICLTLALMVVSHSAAGADEPKADAEEPLPQGALYRLGTACLRHGGEVTCVAFAPDGKTMATGGKDATVRLWDRNTLRELRPYRCKSSVAAVLFSPNGATLASVEERGIVRLWESATAKELRSFAHLFPQFNMYGVQPSSRIAGPPTAKPWWWEPRT